MIGEIVRPTHLLLILVVALVVLGPRRLPQAGRAVGRSIHDFTSAINVEPPAPRREQVTGEAGGRAAEHAG